MNPEVSPVPEDMPTVEELRAFVGPNADYYLAVWEPALNGTGSVQWGNKFALFFAYFWLALRRMTAPAIGLLAVWMVALLVETAIVAVEFKLAEVAEVVSVVVALGIMLACGVCGNRWYFEHAREEVAEVRAQKLPPAEHLAALADRGGLSWITLLAFILFHAAAVWAVMKVNVGVRGW